QVRWRLTVQPETNGPRLSLHCAAPSSMTGFTVGPFPTMRSAAAAQPSSTRASLMHAGRTARYTRPVVALARRCGFRRGEQLVADDEAEAFARDLVESAGD